MTVLQEIKSLNKINQKEFETVSRIVSESLMIIGKNENHSQIAQKEELIRIFSSFLEKYLEMQFVNSNENKLYLINFIDKLNMQKELLELIRGETKISGIKSASQRLGRKSQSAFKTK